MKRLAESVKYLEARADSFKEKKPEHPARARMLYDAAWAARALADMEIEAARETIRQEKWQKMKDEVARKTPVGKTPPNVPAPEITLTMVPVQESEKKAPAIYKALIDAFPDLESSTDARFEFSELLAER